MVFFALQQLPLVSLKIPCYYPFVNKLNTFLNPFLYSPYKDKEASFPLEKQKTYTLMQMHVSVFFLPFNGIYLYDLANEDCIFQPKQVLSYNSLYHKIALANVHLLQILHHFLLPLLFSKNDLLDSVYSH